MYGVSRKCQPGVSQGGRGQPHVSADTFSHFSCHIIRHIELIPMKYISEGCIYADYMQPIYWYLVESVTLPWINESPCLLLDQIHGSTDDFESDESDYMEAEETVEMGNARVYRNVFDYWKCNFLYRLGFENALLLYRSIKNAFVCTGGLKNVILFHRA